MTGTALGSFLSRVGAQYGSEGGVGQEASCSPIGGNSWGQCDTSCPGRARYQFASEVTHLFCRLTAQIGHLAHLNLWPNPEVAPIRSTTRARGPVVLSPVHLRVMPYRQLLCLSASDSVSYTCRVLSIFSKGRNTELGLLSGSSRFHPCRHPKNPAPSLFLELWAPPPFPQGCDWCWCIWLPLF